MTDNEIIKALECCIKLTTKCSECPYNETGEMCFDLAKEDAIKLINRQRAEIERLEKENHRFVDIGKTYSEVRAEAIKEFAELVKANQRMLFNHIYSRPHFAEAIDNLVKEMTEGSDPK